MSTVLPIKKKDQIHVTAKVWGDRNVPVLIEHLNRLHDFMNAHLDLKKYGEGVHFIGFIFVFQPTERDFHPNYLHYSKAHTTLTIQYRLPYEQMVQTDATTIFQNLVYYFLEALETYHQADAHTLYEASDNIEDFNFTAWKEDVERWFEAEGWLAKQPIV